MPKYFFVVTHRGRDRTDTFGMDLRDETHAIREAMSILEHIVEEAQIGSKPSAVAITIRSDRGACLYEATVSLARAARPS